MGEVQLNDVWVPSAIASHFINEERVPFSYTKPNPNLINRPTKLDASNADPVLPLVATTKNMAQPVHLQYNSPMPIYSREAAEEEYQHQLGGTSPIPMPVGDKHFDPEKSSTLKFIKEGNEGNFGEHFFEQIASAEAPKVYPRQEPEWAQCAREKSERARSRTPADPTHHYTPSTTPLSTHHHEYQHNETPREFMEKSRTFTHTNRPQYGPSYHQTQSFQRRRGHSEPRETRGYECGGLDYTKGLYFPSVHYDQYYENRSNSLRRASDATNVRPGYEMGGTDFGKGYVAPGPYRGHGPDPPRLRPRYSADPRSPCNSYYAPNVDEVDANLLVGDTISNQKIRHEVRHINQNEFGTSFAPPPGFKRDHITLRRSPQPPEPITFSLSANKSRYGGSVSNILNHSRQTPMWRQPTAQETREIFINEPNWSRTVKERRNAWERKAFDRETHLDRQQFGKVYHSQQSPAWYSKAERTHNAWRQAADRMNTEGVHPHPEQQHFESSQTTYHQSGGAQPYQSHSYHDDHKQHQQQEHQNSPIQSHITSQHSESYKVAQSVPTHQTHITSGLANGNNADLQLNTGYNMNQADYIRDHFDKYRAGPRYGSSHFEQMNQSSYSKTYSSSSSQQQQHLTQHTSSQAPSATINNYQHQQQQHTNNYGHSNIETTRIIPVQPEKSYEKEERFYKMLTSEKARTIPIQPVMSEARSFEKAYSSKEETHSVPIQSTQSQFKESNYHRNESTKHETTRTIPIQPVSNLHELHSKTHSSQSTTQVVPPPSVQPIQNYSSSSYHTESHSTQNPPVVMQHSPGGSYKSYQSSHYSKQEKTTSTTTTQQPQQIHTTVLPITKTTSYTYQQQSVPTMPAPVQMSQSSFTSHTEKTSTAPEFTSTPTNRSNYQAHLSSHREESQREETTRPTSQLSSFSEQKSYKRNVEEKTETRTVPTTTKFYTSDSNKNFSTADVFNKREEMNETLPPGSISNTHANAQGGYRDQHGHDVSYKREMQTAVDPGKEYALLKEEEQRVVETDLEPGVISRHVTTKYYKKKTVTDTTTTTTSAPQ